MNTQDNSNQFGAGMLIVGTLLFLGMLAYLINSIIYKTPETKVVLLDGTTRIEIPISRDNHYYIRGSINSVSVLFLIDTGATSVALSANLAKTAGLKHLYSVNTNTAAGLTKSYGTNIDKLIVGPYQLDNVEAIITPAMDDNTVLLGMNVLQRLEVSIKDETLILEYKDRNN